MKSFIRVVIPSTERRACRTLVAPPTGNILRLLLLASLFIPPCTARAADNELSATEKADGWVLLLDGKSIVRPRESLEWTRRLVADAGIFAGISAGAAMAGAVKVARKIESGVIVFIVADAGWKYLSTGAYTDDLDAAEAKAEKIIYF